MQRRVLSIVTALALSVAALTAASPAMADEPPPGAAYVALGDSEAAGTGNLPYVDRECLRSARAYPTILGAWFGGTASSACSGATTDDVMAGQLGDLGAATQLVTLTVGINNADWQGVLAACSSEGSTAACSAAYAAASAALADLPTKIGMLVGAIRMHAPNAYIAVTGYPMLFGPVTGSCSVGAYKGTPVKFTAFQAGLANSGIVGVNASIAGGVAGYIGATGDPGVEYVDVASGFAGHGLCDTGDRWISGLVSGAPVFDRGFHANAAGQQAFASIIAGAIAP